MRPKLINALLLSAALSACGGEEETVTPIAPGTATGPATPGTAPAEGAAPAAAAAPAGLPPAPPMPTITLSPEDTARAAEVAPQVRSGFFPSELRQDKTLGQVFLYLAATSDNDDVVVGALKALSSSWTVSPRQVEREYTMATEEVIGVLATRIRDPRPRIQAAAIDAGSFAFRGDDTNEVLLEAYLALAVPSQPAPLRYAVLNNVWQARTKLGSPARIQPYLDAVDAPEPWLVSMALWRLESLVPREASFGAAVRATALERTRHADPGVRGRAMGLLATLTRRMNEGEPERVAATARAIELMADENPYVKAEGMSASSDLQNVAAIHTMIPLLADATPNTYNISGWTTLAGTSGRVHHDGSAWSQVRDSALYAIKNLSRHHNRETMFEYDINGRTKDDDLAAAATAANTWYEANRASLPE